MTPRDELLALLAQVEEVASDPEATEGEVIELTRMCATRANEILQGRAREMFSQSTIQGV